MTIRVQIVDDQDLFAEGLKHVVEGESNGRISVVGIAGNGQEAIQMAEELEPDVILMDVRMPVMDGVEATRTICQRTPNIKIMMLTTFDDDDLVFDALGAGANGYVLKSIEPKDIVLAIEAVRSGALFVSPSVGLKLIETPKSGSNSDCDASVVAELVARIPDLTIREGEVIEQVLKARRNVEIAAALSISEKTVRNHISIIYEKLGIHNRLRLIRHIRSLDIDSNMDV